MQILAWPQIIAPSVRAAAGLGPTPIPQTSAGKDPRYVMLTSATNSGSTFHVVQFFTDPANAGNPFITGFVTRPHEPLICDVSGMSHFNAGQDDVICSPIENTVLAAPIPRIVANCFTESLDSANSAQNIGIPKTSSGKFPKFIRLAHTGAGNEMVFIRLLVSSGSVTDGFTVRRDAMPIINVTGVTEIRAESPTAGILLNLAPLENRRPMP